MAWETIPVLLDLAVQIGQAQPVLVGQRPMPARERLSNMLPTVMKRCDFKPKNYTLGQHSETESLPTASFVGKNITQRSFRGDPGDTPEHFAALQGVQKPLPEADLAPLGRARGKSNEVRLPNVAAPTSPRVHLGASGGRLGAKNGANFVAHTIIVLPFDQSQSMRGWGIRRNTYLIRVGRHIRDFRSAIVAISSFFDRYILFQKRLATIRFPAKRCVPTDQ